MDFINAQGYTAQIEKAKTLIDRFNGKLGIPKDVALNDGGRRVEVQVEEISASDLPINDIGLETIVAYSAELRAAQSVILNGPAGVSELDGFELGTSEIIKAATEANYSIAGGGHISAEVRQMGFERHFSHISTGGGSCINYLAGDKLPAIEALYRAAQLYREQNNRGVFNAGQQRR
jgi:phosphoglycerate kinase